MKPSTPWSTERRNGSGMAAWPDEGDAVPSKSPIIASTLQPSTMRILHVEKIEIPGR